MIKLMFIGLGAILFITFIALNMRHKFPVMSSAFVMILGVGSLAAAAYLLHGLGLMLAVNTYTVLVSLALGMPGVGLMALYLLL